MKLNPATILTILSILTILVTSAKWWIDIKVEKEVNKEVGPFKKNVEDIAHEVRTNGGESIKDQVTRTESDIKDLKKDVLGFKEYNANAQEDRNIMSAKLDDLYKTLIEYVTRPTRN